MQAAICSWRLLMCSANFAAACATDARCIRTLYCRCMRAAEGERHSTRFICHTRRRARTATQRPLPPQAAARSMSECTAATAKRRPQLESGFSFHKLEAATLATPGIYTFSCVQHFTFLNKSAKQNQISCSTEQRCSSGNRRRRSIKK